MKALITGITGQDGALLAEFLLGHGYEVHGIMRRSSSFNTGRVDHLYQDPHLPGTKMFLHFGDLTDAGTLRRIVATVKPDEVYNLGAQSHVAVSFEMPEYTADTVALGTIRLLEAVRLEAPRARFYQASSSEMFGASPPPQTESTPFHPRSPYGCAKVFAYHAAINYREAYGLFVANGILFNHESPLRGETFVTRKITRAVGRIKAGMQFKVYLGNLDARRDWGWAPDYVRGMWMMLQAPLPHDLILATGDSYSVREFAQIAFEHAGLDWREHVESDIDRYGRPAEVAHLLGDASAAESLLGWRPTIPFPELVRRMVEADVALAKRERAAKDAC